jgi:hypothetical protein
MKPHMRMTCLLLFALLCTLGLAAAPMIGIFGVVRDRAGHILPGADIQAQSESTGARWKTRADESGRYSLDGLAPGLYKLTVRYPGFRTMSRLSAVVDPDGLSVDFAMDLLSLHEVVTVASGRDEIDPSSSGGLLLTRDSPGAALPASSSDFRALFDLMPGILITPAGANDGGQFSSNGQRPNSNAFRVDGVSANSGVGASTLPGSFPGAALPAMSAIGSTDALGSSETAQSVELRTAELAPESGERLGSQAIITSRSGSNEFHGDIFANLRDGSWSARDWFANSYGIDYARPSYHDFGGVFGGPIWRNKTFFFLSVENSQLNDSGLDLTTVPTLSERQNAPASVQALLNAFPAPIGSDVVGGEAQGLMGLGRNASVSSYAARLDQVLGSWGTMFARYVCSPSSSYASSIDAIQGAADWRSLTVGLTAGEGRTVHEIRLGYSRADFRSTYADTPWGPAFPLAGLWPSSDGGGIVSTIGTLLPAADSSATVWAVSIPNLGEFMSGDYGKTSQTQWSIGHTVAVQASRHQIRIGWEYLQLTPSRSAALTSVLGAATSLQSLLDGDPLAVTITQSPRIGATSHNLALYAQDTVRLARGLNVLYGIRWEITPPIAGRSQFYSVSGLWSGANWTTAGNGNAIGEAPWPMHFGQIAPRLGVAYRLPKSDLVLRAGVGIFYDTALGMALDSINGAPFNSWLLAAGATGATEPPAGAPTLNGSLTPDVLQFLSGPYPPLRLPASYQWKVSLERHLGSRGLGSLAYLGSANRNLLGNEMYVDPGTGVLERRVTLTENSSSYSALQARYTGSLTDHVYVSSSYTWSHCIDNGSNDSTIFLIHPGYDLKEARASCDFDVRQSLTAALSYQMGRSGVAAHLPSWLVGWTISGVFRAHTGFPIDVITGEQMLGLQVDNVDRPSLVSNQPIWIGDSSVAGGRRLNPAAFAVPSDGQQGTLGRNAIYGNGLTQMDVSLRRHFGLTSRTSLEVSLNVFNVLNHPAFANPVPFLNSPLFGLATSMQNLMLGSGTPNTGLPPLFQTGGSRSAEIHLRVSF